MSLTTVGTGVQMLRFWKFDGGIEHCYHRFCFPERNGSTPSSLKSCELKTSRFRDGRLIKSSAAVGAESRCRGDDGGADGRGLAAGAQGALPRAVRRAARPRERRRPEVRRFAGRDAQPATEPVRARETASQATDHLLRARERQEDEEALEGVERDEGVPHHLVVQGAGHEPDRPREAHHECQPDVHAEVAAGAGRSGRRPRRGGRRHHHGRRREEDDVEDHDDGQGTGEEGQEGPSAREPARQHAEARPQAVVHGPRAGGLDEQGRRHDGGGPQPGARRVGRETPPLSPRRDSEGARGETQGAPHVERQKKHPRERREERVEGDDGGDDASHPGRAAEDAPDDERRVRDEEGHAQRGQVLPGQVPQLGDKRHGEQVNQQEEDGHAQAGCGHDAHARGELVHELRPQIVRADLQLAVGGNVEVARAEVYPVLRHPGRVVPGAEQERVRLEREAPARVEADRRRVVGIVAVDHDLGMGRAGHTRVARLVRGEVRAQHSPAALVERVVQLPALRARTDAAQPQVQQHGEGGTPEIVDRFENRLHLNTLQHLSGHRVAHGAVRVPVRCAPVVDDRRVGLAPPADVRVAPVHRARPHHPGQAPADAVLHLLGHHRVHDARVHRPVDGDRPPPEAPVPQEVDGVRPRARRHGPALQPRRPHEGPGRRERAVAAGAVRIPVREEGLRVADGHAGAHRVRGHIGVLAAAAAVGIFPRGRARGQHVDAAVAAQLDARQRRGGAPLLGHLEQCRVGAAVPEARAVRVAHAVALVPVRFVVFARLDAGARRARVAGPTHTTLTQSHFF